MAHTRNKQKSMKNHMRMLAIILVPVVAIILGAAAPQALASGWRIEECEEGLEESVVFFEFNSKDCDVGIQFFWDGPPWKSMIVKDEHRRSVLDVFPLRNVRAVGLTEALFEGNEPRLIDEDKDCDLEKDSVKEAIAEFISQYKEGPYTFKGMAAEERCLLLGDAELTYDILTPAVFDDPIILPTISWAAPEELLFGGTSDVVGYEMVVELVVQLNGDEQVFKETTTLPAGSTTYTVSESFMNLIRRSQNAGIVEELKIEILADEESGNRTITETDELSVAP